MIRGAAFLSLRLMRSSSCRCRPRSGDLALLEFGPVLHDHNFAENVCVVANDELAQIVDAAQPTWSERLGDESGEITAGSLPWLRKVLQAWRSFSAE